MPAVDNVFFFLLLLVEKCRALFLSLHCIIVSCLAIFFDWLLDRIRLVWERIDAFNAKLLENFSRHPCV